jgi:hypothetical protein
MENAGDNQPSNHIPPIHSLGTLVKHRALHHKEWLRHPLAFKPLANK